MPPQTVLFDLDGTLSDPAEGIVAAYEAMLAELDRPSPGRAALVGYIGPPARTNLRELLDTDDPGLIEQALALFRASYESEGHRQVRIYPHTLEMLQPLADAGLSLHVVTSKMERLAEVVVGDLGLADFFEGVHGARPDSSLDDKRDLMRSVVERRGLDPAGCVMVGDRRFDIEAAHANGMRAIGVTWGYGSRLELEEAGADAICETPAGVVAKILS